MLQEVKSEPTGCSNLVAVGSNIEWICSDSYAEPRDSRNNGKINEETK